MNSIFFSIGRRKTSVARVFSKSGNGKIIINGIFIDKYFFLKKFKLIIMQVFGVIKNNNFLNNYNYNITVRGGGISSQCIAIRLAISRILLKFDISLRKYLKPLGFLTRDSRIVERKKYGLRKSRCRHQYSKR